MSKVYLCDEAIEKLKPNIVIKTSRFDVRAASFSGVRKPEICGARMRLLALRERFAVTRRKLWQYREGNVSVERFMFRAVCWIYQNLRRSRHWVFLSFSRITALSRWTLWWNHSQCSGTVLCCLFSWREWTLCCRFACLLLCYQIWEPVLQLESKLDLNYAIAVLERYCICFHFPPNLDVIAATLSLITDSSGVRDCGLGETDV